MGLFFSTAENQLDVRLRALRLEHAKLTVALRIQKSFVGEYEEMLLGETNEDEQVCIYEKITLKKLLCSRLLKEIEERNRKIHCFEVIKLREMNAESIEGQLETMKLVASALQSEETNQVNLAVRLGDVFAEEERIARPTKEEVDGYRALLRKMPVAPEEKKAVFVLKRSMLEEKLMAGEPEVTLLN